MDLRDAHTVEEEAPPSLRLVLIGGRWSGKSMSGNTILGTDTFECGRSRSSRPEVRQGQVAGRTLTVVDTVGWSGSLSLSEVPERERQRFKWNPSRCLPGPHAFLLVVPIDTAFTAARRRTLEEHMKLLGGRVWSYTMVLFTCGDFLHQRSIEQHVEDEGEHLRWLVEKCGNRYHVFSNKDRSNSSQVPELLRKLEDLERFNQGHYYMVDHEILRIVEERQQEIQRRAEQRQQKVKEQRERLSTLLRAAELTPALRMVLLGSHGLGKTSLANIILGVPQDGSGERTAEAVARQGRVNGVDVTLVDTPGWWRSFAAPDTPQATKEEVVRGAFLCPPGPHIFLLVIDADASFGENIAEAVRTHVELLGDVWDHTMVVFNRGDWLGTNSIEEHVEEEGQHLQELLERCGNRYHLIDSKHLDDGTQVTELLQKVRENVTATGGRHFEPDSLVLRNIEQRRAEAQRRAKLRQQEVQARQTKASAPELQELQVIMFGQKVAGKSASGNTLLLSEEFPTFENQECRVKTGRVAGRELTVIDTPGWSAGLSRTEKMDQEMVRGLFLCPSGVHAVLLVVPVDVSFRDAQLAAVEEHVGLLGDQVWKHCVVLFTYGDKLAHLSIEEHIEREPAALHRLVEKCQNRYHVFNNKGKAHRGQVTGLIQKIEEMVARNQGELFIASPDQVQERIREKTMRRELKRVLKQRLLDECGRREQEQLESFRHTLLQLQAALAGSRRPAAPEKKEEKGVQLAVRLPDRERPHKAAASHNLTSTPAPPSPVVGEPAPPVATAGKRRGSVPDWLKLRPVGIRKKVGSVESIINSELERLDRDLLRCSQRHGHSQDILFPDFSGEGPVPAPDASMSSSSFENVMHWLSNLQLGTNADNQLTLNFSQSSGYRSLPGRRPEEDLEEF